MPDAFGVYDDFKVWEYLDFFAAAYKVPKGDRPGLIDMALELTTLTVKKDAYVDELSRGMKQRLCLAKTLIHDPKVLLLDEPASGLDPRARIEIKELLKELKAMGQDNHRQLTYFAGACGLLYVGGDYRARRDDCRWPD